MIPRTVKPDFNALEKGRVFNDEGGRTVATITVSNPTPATPVMINEILVSVPFNSDSPQGIDPTDALTLEGATVNLAGCKGPTGPVTVLGILAGGGIETLDATTPSCTDNIIIPTLAGPAPGEADEHPPPDTGVSTINASAVTPDGIHSPIETFDVTVEDVPEPSSFLVLGSGLLALSVVLGWKYL